MSQSVPTSRIASLVCISGCSGAAIGFVAALLCVPFVSPVGFVVGGIVGLAVSPALAIALARKDLLRGTALVAGPALVAAVMGGFAQNPLVSLLSVVVFVAMTPVANLVLPDVVPWQRPGACSRCGYDIRTLRQCPECGLNVGEEPQPGERTLRVGERKVLAALILLCIVVPLLGVTMWAARDRNRVRSTAELIEQLGNNDMQLQWEARQQLARQGSGPLIQALRHPNAGVRRNAAWALESLRDPAARAELTRLLDDPDPWTRDHAKNALDALPPE